MQEVEELSPVHPSPDCPCNYCTGKAPHRSPYFDEIRRTLARLGFIGMDPRHIEGWMRLECGTLDSLTQSRFNAEVQMGVACTKADPEGAEDLARSFGL